MISFSAPVCLKTRDARRPRQLGQINTANCCSRQTAPTASGHRSTRSGVDFGNDYPTQIPYRGSDRHLREASLIQATEIRQADGEVCRTIAWSSSPDDRYQVLRPLAKGGLGLVSVALDEELKREVAFKEIQEEYAHDEDGRARFVQEAEITGRHEHPGIVPVYGLGQYDDGRPYYAMRLVKGENLRDAVKQFHEATDGRARGQSLTLRELLGRFIDVCNAVEYAHSRGVLHRDIKPANVMLGKFGETLVVDWGLAKAIGRSEEHRSRGEETLQPMSGGDSSRTRLGSAIVTPSFMSPEQAAGRLDELRPTSVIPGLPKTNWGPIRLWRRQLRSCCPPGCSPTERQMLRIMSRKSRQTLSLQGTFMPPASDRWP